MSELQRLAKECLIQVLELLTMNPRLHFHAGELNAGTCAPSERGVEADLMPRPLNQIPGLMRGELKCKLSVRLSDTHLYTHTHIWTDVHYFAYQQDKW